MMAGNDKKEIDDLSLTWFHSLQVFAQTPEGYEKFREVEDKASKKWLEKVGMKFDKKKSPYEAAMSFAEFFNNMFEGRKFEVEEIGKVLKVHLKGYCPYADACLKTQRKRMKIVCLRAPNFLTSVKEMANQEFKSELTQFNPSEECILNLLLYEIGLDVVISLKLTKGTVRISEKSIAELGLATIDTVTVRHTKSGKSFTAMCYSSSKVPRGAVYLSMPDAKILELKEGDRVTVERARRGATEELVKEAEYGGEYGFEEK